MQTIASERRNLEGAKAVMRAVQASSRNEAVLQQAQNEVRSAEASIRFLEDELSKVQLGSVAGAGSPMRGEGSSSRGGYSSQQMMTPSRSGASNLGGNGISGQVSPSPSMGRDRPLPPPPAEEVGKGDAKPKNYTQLGMPILHMAR